MNVFFTDRDLGKAFPAMLRDAGIQIEEAAKHFAPNTSDDVWLDTVGQRRWFVRTHDRRIRYKPNELAAVATAGVGMFVLIGQVSTRELAANFIRTFASVEKFIARSPRPFIARVYRPAPSELARNPSAAGRVEPWLSAKGFGRRKRGA
ncbi:MAG: hypothetical protein ACREOG_23485 [Gemmatimonadaceae bacterium]